MEMPERKTRNSGRRRRGNDASGAFDATPGSTAGVKFSVVEIREFERVVGDNPSCSSGVPVSIGWNHGKTFTMNLEDFEKARPPRRAQMDLVLTRGERHRLLVEWGASGQDVIEAIRMIIRVKNQRRQTVNNLGSYDRVEEVFENLSRSIRNMVCRSSTSKVARKLREDSERAATMKKMQTSGQASSSTANETLTGSSAPPRKGNNGKASNGQDTALFKEVSLVQNIDDGSKSEPENANRDALANKGKKKQPPPDVPVPEESPLTGEQPVQREVSTIGAPTAGKGGIDNSVEEFCSRNKNGISQSDAYDNDADDEVSNPQSHDHHSEGMSAAANKAPVQAIGGTVDI